MKSSFVILIAFWAIQCLSIPCHMSLDRGRCEIETAVVIGGGPAGSASALALVEQGVKNIYVIERRCSEYSRPIHFNLRSLFRQTMKSFGIEEEFLKICGKIAVSKSQDDILGIDTEKTPPEYEEQLNVKDFVLNHYIDIFKNPSLYQCKASELETMFHKEAEKRGVKYSFSNVVNVNRPESPRNKRGMYTITAPESPFQEQIKNPDLIVVADGKACSTARSLGLSQEIKSRATYHIAGLYNKGIGGKSFFKVYQHDGKVNRVVILGHEKLDETWAVVQVPESQIQNSKIWSPDQILENYERIIKDASGDLIPPGANVIWGGKTIFPVQSTKLNKPTLGNNVVFVGDSARAANFQTGGGCLTAVVADTVAIKKLTEDVKDIGLEAAFIHLDKRIRKNSDAWISASLSPIDLYESNPGLYLQKYKQNVRS